MRNCPDCHVRLAHLVFREVELDSCPVCAGIWFDAEEIRRITTDGEGALRELDKQVLPHAHVVGTSDIASAMCPSCGAVMYRYRYQYSSDITLESCTKCSGIWVRDGDLDRMVAWMRGEAEAPEGQVERTARERFADIDGSAERESHLSAEKVAGFAEFVNRRRGDLPKT